MKHFSILVLLILAVMGFGAEWSGRADAAESALPKTIFYVG